MLQYYYSNQAKEGGDNISLPGDNYSAEDKFVPNTRSSNTQPKIDAFITEFKAREGSTSMSIHPTTPIQGSYHASVISPAGDRLTIPSTPSDYRAWYNFKRGVREIINKQGVLHVC